MPMPLIVVALTVKLPAVAARTFLPVVTVCPLLTVTEPCPSVKAVTLSESVGVSVAVSV